MTTPTTADRIGTLSARLETKAKRELHQAVHAQAYKFVNALKALGVSEFGTLEIKNGPSSVTATVNVLPQVLANAVVAYYGARYASAAVEKFIEKVEALDI